MELPASPAGDCWDVEFLNYHLHWVGSFVIESPMFSQETPYLASQEIH